MRVCRFERAPGDARVGIIRDDAYVSDLSSAGLPIDTIDVIREWDLAKVEATEAISSRIDLDEVKILAPLVPRKGVIAVGRNYTEHSDEFTRSGFDKSDKGDLPKSPIVFTKAPTSVIGNDEFIVLANDPTSTTDYEGELAVVIGRECRRVSRSTALDYVFGWTIVNDVTARDLQKRHIQWFLGKSPDTFCPMGPWITTIDEMPDVRAAWIRTKVNGELRQESSLADLIFDVESLLVTLSSVLTLEPGDVIATGTGKGVGIGFEPPRYLASGDVVEVSVEGIGTLRNPVI